jgi:hypothetical protein
VASSASCSPVLFQGLPYWSPVLRGRLHDDFLDLVLDQPVGSSAEIGRRRPDLLALEVEVTIDLNVGHYDRQHLLVDINSRDLVWHRPLQGERRARLITAVRVASYRRFSPRPNDAQLFDQSRTLRIKQLLGLNGSTGSIRSRARAILAYTRFS